MNAILHLIISGALWGLGWAPTIYTFGPMFTDGKTHNWLLVGALIACNLLAPIWLGYSLRRLSERRP